jgi:hypothetical protein
MFGFTRARIWEISFVAKDRAQPGTHYKIDKDGEIKQLIKPEELQWGPINNDETSQRGESK